MALPRNICAPPKPRCTNVNYPIFQTPISSRRVPECTPPGCPEECTGGNPELHVTNLGTLDRSKWIEGWITRQLFTRGHVHCDEHPLGQHDGGWWADAFRADKFSSGSKLWSLKWARVNNDTLIAAKEYTMEALQYLLQWGIVSTLTVSTRYMSSRMLHILIKITGPGISREFVFQGTAMPDSTFLWEEYRPGPAKTTIPIAQRALVA